MLNLMHGGEYRNAKNHQRCDKDREGFGYKALLCEDGSVLRFSLLTETAARNEHLSVRMSWVSGHNKAVISLNDIGDLACTKTNVKRIYLLGSEVAVVRKVRNLALDRKLILVFGNSGSVAEDVSIVELNNSVRKDVCLVKVVRNDDNELLLGNLLKHAENFSGGLVVKVTGKLVTENKLRILRQCSCDSNSLLLTA